MDPDSKKIISDPQHLGCGMQIRILKYGLILDSVADPDPGSGTFLTPGSGIRNRFFPDPGSDHYFRELKANFFLG